jgi:NodT family efflux transporter outer membrane factor (OMF) lipoprotein
MTCKLECRLLALTIVFVTSLAGCTVGPDFKRPTEPDVSSFTRDKELNKTFDGAVESQKQVTLTVNRVEANWWKSFSSEKLNNLIEIALKNNQSIKAAEASIKQANDYVAAQKGYFYPTVQAGYAASRQGDSSVISPTLQSNSNPYTLHTAQLSISYAPDVFGLNKRTVESLEAQAENQKFQLTALRTTLISNVISAVIQQASIQSQIEATEKIILSQANALNIIKKQFDLGYASDVDVTAQESNLDQAKQLLPPLNKQLEITKDLIAILCGKLPSQGGLDSFTLDEINLPVNLPITLPSSLVEQRPDVRAAEAQMHAASALIGVALANRLPQFSISALYGGSSTKFGQMFSTNNSFWGLTGNVGQTLFDAGTLKYKQKAAEAGFEQAEAQYRNVVLGAYQNVADTLYALDADAKSLLAATGSETSARKSLDLVQKQLDLGYVNSLALINSEQTYQQAKISKIQAQAMRLSDTLALFQSLGGDWEDPH